LYLNAYQRRFLRFFLEGPPSRAVWRNAGGHVVGHVADMPEPPADAAGVTVNRHSDGRYEAPGMKTKETSLPIRELAGLAPCWDRPLWSLNEVGRQVAEAPDPGPGVTVAGKVHPHLEKRFTRLVKAQGRTPGDVIAELVLRYVEGKL
jgi:hypothetical protein